MQHDAHLAQPPEDPGSLSDFPVFVLTPSQTVFRIHSEKHGPWWFASDTESRFNLTAPRGTCYVSESQLGAFIERFQDFAAIFSRVIAESKIASLRVPHPFRVADCTVSQTRGYGLTGEIHTIAERAITLAWARAFLRDGFDGVRYFARHDPSMTHKSIALFGAAGEMSWPVRHDRSIDERLKQRAKGVFGVKILPMLP